MNTIRDYAKTEHMEKWLRHPVLGDPSFDTFERIGIVHRSEPPYEWAVNGSIFRDFDGTWYYYAGLYAYGYGTSMLGRFKIYRSTDRGAHWEDLGFGMETGFRFEGDGQDSDTNPDVVVYFDKKTGKYLLTYDTGNNDCTGEDLFDPHTPRKTGVALAWADSPAGPFHRYKTRILTNTEVYGCCGRFIRFYATTVVPREKDYIAFSLTDSNDHFSWGLAVLTAPTPEGPWSLPHIVLSCDRPEYYPCPLEFFPAEVHNGTVCCSATSVAMNRNYQAVFEAPLEEAHDPSAWRLTANGNVWHAADHPDDHHGIWGQTYHGFVEPDTGRYVVMYPAKDTRNYGTLSLAARPWDTPHSDGFTMTAHGGESVSPILAAYKDFTLDAVFTYKGSVDIAFSYDGVLGPHDSCSDATPADTALSGYCALRFSGTQCAVVAVSKDGAVKVLAEAAFSKEEAERQTVRLWMQWKEKRLSVRIDGRPLFDRVAVTEACDGAKTPALILQKFSRIECERFALEGDACAYTLTYNAADALLGAGQRRPQPETVDPTGTLAADVWHRTADGYVGEGLVAAKWNVIGSDFILPLKRSAAYGTIGVWADGNFFGSVNLQGEGETCFEITNLKTGTHAIRVAPIKGRIAITKLIVKGNM